MGKDPCCSLDLEGGAGWLGSLQTIGNWWKLEEVRPREKKLGYPVGALGGVTRFPMLLPSALLH